MTAEVAEGLPPDIIPEGFYSCRLVDRRYGSDTWEIDAPDTPWHGRKVYINPRPIMATVVVKHVELNGIVLAQGKLA
jgi:hypothetical protein